MALAVDGVRARRGDSHDDWNRSVAVASRVMGRPSRTEARDVRRLLIEETVRVIAESGEQSVRTKAVAEAVGVTEPALFHYFGNREGLIEEAQAHRFETTQIDVLVKFRVATMKCTKKEQFARVVIATLEGTFAKGRAANREARINIAGSATSRPRLKRRLIDAQRSALAPLVDSVNYARGQGWVRAEVDADAFAYWIVAQITGRYFAEIDGDQKMLRALNTTIVRATLHELGLDAPAR